MSAYFRSLGVGARVSVIIILVYSIATCGLSAEPASPLVSTCLRDYLLQRTAEFSEIPAERKEELTQLASFVSQQVSQHKRTQLTFICTHNSRRSHFGQVWAKVAADYYGIPNVQTFSGGTEATAFNPRAVAAVERAGIKVSQSVATSNPVYRLQYLESGEALECFSKKYDAPPNPRSDFCAIMTCSQADTACPLVPGSSRRIAVRYEDPKVSDGTPEETSVYDQRCRQICREMLFMCSLVKK